DQESEPRIPRHSPGPAQDECFGIGIQVAVTEGGGIDGVEELPQLPDVDLDHLAVAWDQVTCRVLGFWRSSFHCVSPACLTVPTRKHALLNHPMNGLGGFPGCARPSSRPSVERLSQASASRISADTRPATCARSDGSEFATFVPSQSPPRRQSLR